MTHTVYHQCAEKYKLSICLGIVVLVIAPAAKVSALSCSLSVSPASIYQGQSATLSITGADAMSVVF
jgi:hypothetical protein